MVLKLYVQVLFVKGLVWDGMELLSGFHAVLESHSVLCCPLIFTSFFNSDVSRTWSGILAICMLINNHSEI